MRPWVSILAAGLVLCAVWSWSAGDLLRVEAEKWAAQGGGTVQVIERKEASGGKTVSYWEDPGPWLELAFDVPAEGEYVISLRYSLGWPDTRRELSLDGKSLGSVTLAGTGAWDAFEVATLDLPPLRLAAGRHVLRITNADSRGLSLDWVALHTREVLLADRKLSPDELAELEAAARRNVAPRQDAALKHGTVEFGFSETGQGVFAKIGDCLFATASEPETPGAQWTLHAVGQHRLGVVRGPDQGQLAFWISDGSNLFVVVKSRTKRDVALPAPVVSSDGMRTVEATTGDGERLLLSEAGIRWESNYLSMGGVHITASPGLTISSLSDGAPQVPGLRLRLDQWQGMFIGAARLSTRWGTDRPSIGVGSRKDSFVVRETASRYPTLARFYGEGLFDLVFEPDGSARFTDLATGETLEIGR
ncbi:MAG: carbohydrate-binding protein [Armatimonadetes bacterium]|nr:carbohydrate-binding protein [Armatimonadota bacterium]